MPLRKVLVTGMSGLIGSAVRRECGARYDMSALNRRDLPGVPCHCADIGELDAILPAFDGIDTVVHLAAVVFETSPWKAVLHHNVIGTYNVFEAARRAGVRRIVYASSGAAVSGWEQEKPYDALVEGRYDEVPETWDMLSHDTAPWPKGLYGCSKVWGEALARHFTDTSDLSILCLRMGGVVREDRPTTARHASVWCSQRDMAGIIERCIEAPDDLKFDIFYALSDNRWRYRDLERARNLLGFAPQDSADDFI